MKVYLDYVFIINFLFDFILLLGVSIVLKRNISKFRLFLSSFWGGISGFLILLSISSFLFFVLKILFGLFLVIMCFSYKNIKYTMNNFFYLIILSILLGGFLYLFNIEIAKTRLETIFNSNDVYIISLLLLSFVVTLLYVKYINGSKQGIVNKYKVVFDIEGKSFNLVGYLDTGNSLTYKRRPVLIINNNIEIDLSNRDTIYIPIATVSGSSVIKCFLLKEIIIDDKLFKNIYVGISNDKFQLYDADIILNVKLREDLCEENN